MNSPLDLADAHPGPASGDRMVTAMKARELGRNSVVVGDLVALAGDTSGAAGTLARIVRVLPVVRSALRRGWQFAADTGCCVRSGLLGCSTHPARSTTSFSGCERRSNRIRGIRRTSAPPTGMAIV